MVKYQIQQHYKAVMILALSTFKDLKWVKKPLDHITWKTQAPEKKGYTPTTRNAQNPS